MLDKGECTPVELAQACLERIAARERDVRAWAHIDADAVLKQAYARAAERRRGPLHGIPVGVKDIMHTADMPTEYGSPIYRGQRTVDDAACVALLRDAGCVILGKTETMEFAVSEPARTRNPHNLAHTPGGSSSGSAAAVADFMVPLALGTQTGGSIIRPASYCGVVGYKASYGLISRAGIKPASESLDTVGTLARNVGDAALAASVLAGFGWPPLTTHRSTVRIGVCRSSTWQAALPGTAEALEKAVVLLGRSGFAVRELTLPALFEPALEAQGTVNLYEAYRAFSYERINHPDKISKALSNRLARGAKISLNAYLAAQNVLRDSRAGLAEIFRDVDVLVGPAATGEAPRGLENTGDPIFNRLWTALHVPCVSVPALCGPGALPLGVQVIGPMNSDARTLQIAAFVEARLQEN
jgi:Asp-tRNA(Asn)/Glu-tRNA(Gln) amidotransferase A subunit family amidase